MLFMSETGKVLLDLQSEIGQRKIIRLLRRMTLASITFSKSIQPRIFSCGQVQLDVLSKSVLTLKYSPMLAKQQYVKASVKTILPKYPFHSSFQFTSSKSVGKELTKRIFDCWNRTLGFQLNFFERGQLSYKALS